MDSDEIIDSYNQQENIKADDNISGYNETQHDVIVGMDLGTTNSLVSTWVDGNVIIIPDEYGRRSIPSFVAYTNVSRYIGNDAKNQRELNPENVFYEIKRLIGRKFNDPIVQKEQQFMSYKLGEDEKHNIKLLSTINGDKIFSPEELQAAILTKLKIMASTYLKTPVTKAVITIPAYFNDGQRQATKDAAKIAGIECVRMINEPTAAGLAYGFMNKSVSKARRVNIKEEDLEENKKMTVMVYDFGGGTLDVTLLSVDSGVFEVIASSGNTRLGGSDFDNRLMSIGIAKFSKQYRLDVLNKLSSLSLQKLRYSCEQAKKLLSKSNKTHIAVKNFYDCKDLLLSITRDDLEKFCGDLYLLCLKPVDDILRECNMNVDDVDNIILVGGMTRMPKIRKLIKDKFRKEPDVSINPEEAIAAGAAIQAFIISHQTDPFSQSVTLLDTTTLSLGVETIGGVMDVLIPRGNIIPTEETHQYTTDEDYVDSVMIKIYEGERTMTADNFFVGEFELKGIDPAPRGVPEIEVLIQIDENGIIVVTAENITADDDDTSYKSSLSVTSHKGRLTDDDIERLIDEAKELELKDELEKRKKMLHYQIDDLCSNILMNLKRGEFKLTDIDKKTIKEKIEEIAKWLKEKSYTAREDQEYEDVLNHMKNRYGVLILRGNLDDSSIKSNTEDIKNSTSVYGNDDEDDKHVFERIENEEIGALGLSDPEKEEIKAIRQDLMDLCYSVFDVISSENLNLEKDHIHELKDYVDDVLLWLHVHQDPKITEYRIKIDEVNETCNKIIDHYKKEGTEIFKENELTKSIKTKRDELENMCIVLKLMINDGAFKIKKDILKDFSNIITVTLDWISENDIISVDKPETFNLEKFYEDCELKMTEINSKCEKIHQQMQGIILDDSDMFGKKKILLSGPDGDKKSMGTSIIDLVRMKQQDVIDELINSKINEETDNDSEQDIEDF